MTFQTNKKTPANSGDESLKALFELLCPIWLPLHHSISNLSLEYQVDSRYLKDLAHRLGLHRPMQLAPVG